MGGSIWIQTVDASYAGETETGILWNGTTFSEGTQTDSFQKSTDLLSGFAETGVTETAALQCIETGKPLSSFTNTDRKSGWMKPEAQSMISEQFSEPTI